MGELSGIREWLSKKLLHRRGRAPRLPWRSSGRWRPVGHRRSVRPAAPGLGNLGQLATEVRVLPETRDGRGAGVRLLAIRPESPLAAIGLASGDVIVAINGLELSSPDQAIEAYVKLRNAGHLSLAIERAGQRINQEYWIR